MSNTKIKDRSAQSAKVNGQRRVDRASRAVERLRSECKKKGITGVRGFAVLFRGMDSDYSRTLTLNEVREGLLKYGINVSSEDVRLIFQRMDNDDNGSVDFKEFVLRLTPPMAACRRDVVMEAFDKLDDNKDGVLRIDDLMVSYKAHAQNHPKFRSGEWTIEQVLASFLDTFDSPDDKDGCVTRDEFITYYAGVSCMVDDDSYFDLMMRQSWGLPSKQTLSRNNTQENIRQLAR